MAVFSKTAFLEVLPVQYLEDMPPASRLRQDSQEAVHAISCDADSAGLRRHAPTISQASLDCLFW